jgi:hypothetical protein
VPIDLVGGICLIALGKFSKSHDLSGTCGQLARDQFETSRNVVPMAVFRSVCMLNSSSPFMRTLRSRLVRPGFRQIEDRRPKAFLTASMTCKPVSVEQAIGFDVLVCGVGDWYCGQKIELGFRLQTSNSEFVIPGKIHWREQKQSEVELGIVLDERLPDELVVREPGCERASIRYSSNIPGTLNWLEPHSVSCPAAVVNYSREGICVHSSVSPEIGTEVRFSWLDNDIAHNVIGTSRWVIGKSSGSLTGCELINCYGYAISGVAQNPARRSC